MKYFEYKEYFCNFLAPFSNVRCSSKNAPNLAMDSMHQMQTRLRNRIRIFSCDLVYQNRNDLCDSPRINGNVISLLSLALAPTQFFFTLSLVARVLRTTPIVVLYISPIHEACGGKSTYARQCGLRGRG